MKLFMFYVGGSFANANIELHDLRFAVGDTIESCYPSLREQWWGDPASLHLDCWGEVSQVDGFDITLTRDPPAEGDDRVFLVNLGGGRGDEFTEVHRNVLVVAKDAKAAETDALGRGKALSKLEGWALPHKDRMFDVEQTVDVTEAAETQGYHIRLTRADLVRPIEFSLGFRPIAIGAYTPPGIPTLPGRIEVRDLAAVDAG